VNLKTKTFLLYWSITALFVIPALVLALLAFIPNKTLRADVLKTAKDLSEWRRWTCRDFYVFRKQGFRLTVED
jgi:hypothetical protein